MDPVLALGLVVLVALCVVTRANAQQNRTISELTKQVDVLEDAIGLDGNGEVQGTLDRLATLQQNVEALELKVAAWEPLPEIPNALVSEIARLQRDIDSLEANVAEIKAAVGAGGLSTLTDLAGKIYEVESWRGQVDDRLTSLEKAQDASLLLPETVNEIQQRIGTLRGDIDRLQASEEETIRRLDRHDEAAGMVFWKSSDGHVLRLRDIGDHHLQNMKDGGFGGETMQEMVRAELDRRTNDRAFRDLTEKSLMGQAGGGPAADRTEEALRLARQASATGGALGSLDGPTDVPMYVRDTIRKNLRRTIGDQPEQEGEGF